MPAVSDIPSFTRLFPASHLLWQLEGAGSKKRIFEQVCLLLENVHQLPRDELFRQLMARERLGSTSVGQMGAIPHIRTATIKETICVLVHLAKPICYDANGSDSQVQTLFFLFAPEETKTIHLQMLALFSEMLLDKVLMEALEQCADAEAAHRRLLRWETEKKSSLERLFAGA